MCKDGISIKLADKKWAWDQLTKYFDWLPNQWQRKVETEKLEIERKKLATLADKDKAPDKPSVQPYIDALKGTMREVWDDEAGK